MKKFVLLTFAIPVFSFSYEECQRSIGTERALHIAKQYVGEVYSIRLSKSKRTRECYYQVRGKEGTATIDATSGRLVRFYRSRN